MSETSVQVTITLLDPQLKDEDLDIATQNLRLELDEVQGVTEIGLIPIAQAPANSKGIGGFLLGKLKALVNPEHFKTLVNFVGQNISLGRKVSIKAKGNGRELDIVLSRPEDIDKVMPQVERFIRG